jgi:uncharacterized protein (TIGR03066 family)
MARRKWLIMLLVAMLAFGGTWASFELFVWNRVPAALVGKWVVMEGPDSGDTVEFYRNGTMIALVNREGEQHIIPGTIQVDGKRIFTTTKHPQTGESAVRVQTIQLLEADRLTLQDERGMVVKLKRVE